MEDPKTGKTMVNFVSDRRLSTKHSTVEMLLNIKINHDLWTEAERQEVIDEALLKYLNAV